MKYRIIPKENSDPITIFHELKAKAELREYGCELNFGSDSTVFYADLSEPQKEIFEKHFDIKKMVE